MSFSVVNKLDLYGLIYEIFFHSRGIIFLTTHSTISKHPSIAVDHLLGDQLRMLTEDMVDDVPLSFSYW